MVRRALMIFYCTFTIWAVSSFVAGVVNGNAITVDFIDVGQADGALVTSAGGRTLLIDAGDNDGGERNVATIVRFLNERRVQRLDVVAISHYHLDHYGGMMDLVRNFDIGMLILPKPADERDWNSHDRMLVGVRNDVKVVYAAAGDRLRIGEDLVAEVLFADREATRTNDRTVVKRVTGFESSFLFTGDMGFREEDMMLASGMDFAADVVKVAHHGSRFSSRAEFFRAASPRYAVISVGRNGHGHPTQEAMDRIAESGARILRTDHEGTITFVVDGNGFRRRSRWL